MDYHVVSQGKTTIPGLDDGEELQATDVRGVFVCKTKKKNKKLPNNFFNPLAFVCFYQYYESCKAQ